MTELLRVAAYVTAEELEAVKLKAEKKGLTVSNYLRMRIGLEAIKRGGPVGNRNAAGHVKKKNKADSDESPGTDGM